MKRFAVQICLGCLVLSAWCASAAADGADAAAPAPGPAPAPVQEPTSQKVSAGERVGDLLKDGSLDRLPASPSITGSFLRLLGWTAAVIAIGSAVLLVLKRTPIAGKLLNSGGWIRVLGKTSLSARHSIYLLRIPGQKILVVGVSGDRMTTLSEVGDAAQVLAGGGDFQTIAEAVEQGYSEQPRDRTPDLLPFQREVNKIRRMFQDWRSSLGKRTLPPGVGSKPGLQADGPAEKGLRI